MKQQLTAPFHDFAVSLVRDAPSEFLDGHEKSILQAMLSRGDSIFPSLDRLSSDTGWSRSTVKRKIKSLEAKGWLEIAHGGPTSSNEYQVKIPGSVQRVAEKSENGTSYVRFIFSKDDEGRVTQNLGRSTQTLVVGSPRPSKKEIEERKGSIKSSVAEAPSHVGTQDDVSPEAFSERSELIGDKEGRSTQTLPNRPDDAIASFDLDALLNMQPEEDPKIRCYEADRGPAWSRIRIAGKSKPRPGETELWLTEDEAYQKGIL
jgi:hypothetical protein